MSVQSHFDKSHVLHELKHYLPAQAPLKDFIHHNTLHAFQDLPFHEALHRASDLFGYKVYFSLHEYRQLYQSKRINEHIIERVLIEKKGVQHLERWKRKLISEPFECDFSPRVNSLRNHWKLSFGIDLDSMVHPLLFRTLCSYLDQGISIWSFPVQNKSFLSSIREIERNSPIGFFKSGRTRKLLLETTCEIEDLLEILVGDNSLYEHYLFDQQFAHQGWSGMIASIESQPQTLLEQKKISLQDCIVFELLLEIDALDRHSKGKWNPLAFAIKERPQPFFAPTPQSEMDEVLSLWQEAFEWSYYDQVLAGLELEKVQPIKIAGKSFQAVLCIDDRECSFRRYLEKLDPECETFGTPGFFGVEFFYQPQDSHHITKVCPAPVTPRHLIKEQSPRTKREQDIHFTKHAHSFHGGWLIAQTLGFWSAFRLFLNVFKPSMSPATASSFKHMDKQSRLTIENSDTHHHELGLQVGFTIEEMAIRVENVLRSIGLIKNFAPLVYIIGHGASSVNNPHYAAYDCGACSGRAGSVNARVFSFMANHPKVRAFLEDKGIKIPDSTIFIGAIHDTTRDDIQFFDENELKGEHAERHTRYETLFHHALDLNSKERSRRFVLMDSSKSPSFIHHQIRERSVSLFEPRPELNHATNALCIVGRRELSKGLFLDRRSFLNSYDYRIDPEGKYLLSILNAAAPVCGGINLEYYFSRTDNQKLGAGSKLPHNVMGLFGVANGIDGDLRPGLPSQMVEVHDPVRLLMIVEHNPDVVLTTIQKNKATYDWFKNEWIHLIVIEPESRSLFHFKEGAFHLYKPVNQTLSVIDNIESLIVSHQENFPVFLIKNENQ